MLSKLLSYGLQGLKGYAVRVEVDINSGLPGIEVIGLPDTAIKESKDRVKSAIKNSGFLLSPKTITINLAPADIKKEGSYYDLPIALGILSALGQIKFDIKEYIFLGELSLDGRLGHIKGLLPMLISARENGCKKFIIPKANEKEASFIEGIEVYTFSSLREVVSFLMKEIEHEPIQTKNITSFMNSDYKEDFKFVKGQYIAKRAIEIAAAGNHNILLIGPPGAGKTMMAKCIPSVLPDMTIDEALETTKIHSIAGTLNEEEGIISKRPFRSPHHTASRVSLVGGSANAKPGEMSLAHNGVLFLDEMLEYPRSSLEILRQPLEDGVITISRALRTVEYPANFMLVASMNPCPCGNLGSDKECTCTPAEIARYMNKLSAPLMDRIDLQIEVSSVKYDDLTSGDWAESSQQIKARVNKARQIQLERFKGTNIYSNSKMNNEMLKKYCKLDENCENIMRVAFEKLNMTARAYTKILKVARTIADLQGEENITENHIKEALQYRNLDRMRK